MADDRYMIAPMSTGLEQTKAVVNSRRCFRATQQRLYIPW